MKSGSGNYIAGCALKLGTNTPSLAYCNTNNCNTASLVSALTGSIFFLFNGSTKIWIALLY